MKRLLMLIVAIVLLYSSAFAEEELLAFVNISPKDPRVQKAMDEHKDFMSPLGIHRYIGPGTKHTDLAKKGLTRTLRNANYVIEGPYQYVPINSSLEGMNRAVKRYFEEENKK